MKTQEYLRQFSSTESALSAIADEYGIVNSRHEDGRVILNYRQGVSPKTDPLVRECRGLTLDSKDNWRLVARGFDRFFNIGEHREEQDKFQWNDSIATEKVDGSLVLCYYYRGSWHVNTRGSFATGDVVQGSMTWRQLAEAALNRTIHKYTRKNYNWTNSFNKEYTYIMELCSPYNKVVRLYPEPIVYLLSLFNKENEIDWDTTVIEGFMSGARCPKEYTFSNVEKVINYIESVSENDKTWEGIVLRDSNNLRIKCKSKSYVMLHRALGGVQITPKNILPFVLNGEITELLVYYPEIKGLADEVGEKVDQFKWDMFKLWLSVKDIESQKEYAIAVKDTIYSPVLFTARKLNVNPVDILVDFEDLLLERLFK